ncbi:MAG: 30S ribosomal protein S5 [bacterium]|nr:30S ribosomal protein S5 [bacterium]
MDKAQDVQLIERIVRITRTAKVVKGGRRFGFSALVVVGNGYGKIGKGLGKANEVPDAIRKALEQAKRNMIDIPIKGATIPFRMDGLALATKVILRPAAPGTGVIAGGAVRAVLEGLGVQDILTKVIGSSNALNIVDATFNALETIKNLEEIAKVRKNSIEDVK